MSVNLHWTASHNSLKTESLPTVKVSGVLLVIWLRSERSWLLMEAQPIQRRKEGHCLYFYERTKNRAWKLSILTIPQTSHLYQPYRHFVEFTKIQTFNFIYMLQNCCRYFTLENNIFNNTDQSLSWNYLLFFLYKVYVVLIFYFIIGKLLDHTNMKHVIRRKT